MHRNYLWMLAFSLLPFCGCGEVKVAVNAPKAEIELQAPSSAESEITEKVDSLSDDDIPSVDGSRVSDRFPNIELIDQNGDNLRFYDDLIEDRTVCLVFFYTRCTGSCPGTTVALEKLRHELKGHFEPGELRFISLTLEPDVDSPEQLQEYMDRYQLSDDPELPEWFYCTGDFGELDALRKSLGVYDLDPIIDADKTEHASIITFGNDRLNRWAALPVGLKMDDLKETFLRIGGNTRRQRYEPILQLHSSNESSAKSAEAKTEKISG